jgi:diguanylate cyclase (GGDEF)-like protein
VSSSLRLPRPRLTAGDPAPWTLVYFIAAAGLVWTAAAVLLAPGVRTDAGELGAFAVLACCAAVTDLFTVRGPRSTVYDTAAVFLVAAAIVLPLPLAPFVAIPACLTDAAHRRAARISLAHNVFTAGLATAAASAIAHAGADLAEPARAAVVLAAAASYAAATSGFDSLFGRFAAGDGGLDTDQAGAEFVLATLGVVVAALWRTDAWWIPFALTPIVFIHRSQRLPALRRDAVTDPKTGLLNMRSFDEQLDAALARAGAAGRRLALLVVDLDLLREINNRYGHLAGDTVIQGVSELLRAHVRPLDLAARFGGEEFLLALVDCEAEDAVALAERIRADVASTVFAGDTPRFAARATVSIGVASFPRDAPGRRPLIHAADLAVLAAKRTGRNCVVDAAAVAGEDAVVDFGRGVSADRAGLRDY